MKHVLPLVGRGQPHPVGSSEHLGNLSEALTWKVVHLVENQEAEPVAELSSPYVCGVIGANRHGLDRVLSPAVHPDLDAEFLMHPLPPLLQQVQCRNDYNGRQIHKLDRLHGNDRLSCTGWQDYHSSSSGFVPGAECSLLVPPQGNSSAFYQVRIGRQVLDTVLDCREVALVQELNYFPVVEALGPERPHPIVPGRVRNLGIALYQNSSLVEGKVGGLHSTSVVSVAKAGQNLPIK